MAANLPSEENFDCTRASGSPRVLVVNGTKDPINPFEGGLVTIVGFGPPSARRTRGDLALLRATPRSLRAMTHRREPVRDGGKDYASLGRLTSSRSGAMQIATVSGRLMRLGAAVLVLVPAGRLSAQSRATSAFELAAGPVGSQGTGAGLHLSGAYATALSPSGFGVRFEGTLSIWRPRGASTVGGRTRVSSLGMAFVQTVSRRAVQPYAIAGAGVYLRPGEGFDLGLNAGAGARFRLGPVSVFTEARIHELVGENGQRLVPLTVGVRF